jgi:cytochrome c6
MTMRSHTLLTGTLISAALLAATAQADTKGKIDAKAEFAEHCASCHPAGGNIINPAKTIKKAELSKAGIKTWKDIVAKMRKPGPGMTTFSKQDISDKEAKEIAEYILKTFK